MKQVAFKCTLSQNIWPDGTVFTPNLDFPRVRIDWMYFIRNIMRRELLKYYETNR